MSEVNVCELTRQLIDIPSETGSEAAVGQFLARYLDVLGYRVELQSVTNDRANVIATTAATPRLMVSTHLDTVPPYFASTEDDDYIHGRGSCDAKGIVAAQIAAAEELRATGVTEIGLLFTVDEEAGSSGARAANEHSLASSCQYLINGEPTENKLAIGTKGSLRLRLRAEGRAAHSAYPEQGDSAITKLLDALAAVRKTEWLMDQFFGETTCNIGIISGGRAFNVVPDEAEAELMIRLSVDAEPLKQMIETAVGDSAHVEFLSEHNPVRLGVVEDFEQTVVRFTTDIPYLTKWGTPFLLGPGSILDAHTAHERVSKRDLKDAVALYVRLARSLLANADNQARGSR